MAGLIDGEGCIEILKRKRPECKRKIYYCARLRISNSNKDLIEWLKNSFGGWIEKREIGGNYKDAYVWVITYSKIEPLLIKILPYLKVKKKQGEILRKFLKTFKEENYFLVEQKKGEWKNGGTAWHREIKEKTWDYREELYRQIRELNKKGFAR